MHMKQKAFKSLLHRLSLQSGGEKLHAAFQLSHFVRQLRMQGDAYAKRGSKHKPGATA